MPRFRIIQQTSRRYELQEQKLFSWKYITMGTKDEMLELMFVLSDPEIIYSTDNKFVDMVWTLKQRPTEKK